MIHIKTPEEVAAMREGGKILAQILHELALAAKVGMTTGELNIKAEALMATRNVAPSFKGYKGFPAVICTAVNEEVVHGIPGKRELKNGDIITIDCGVIHKGFHTDAAVAILVGDTDPAVRKFAHTVQKSFEAALQILKPGSRTGDIGHAVQTMIESNGYSVVREFIGHGVGRSLHEEPEVSNCGKKGKGPVLIPGMVIAIEPIIAMGSRFVDIKSDGWTAITRDGNYACQIEHTVAITPSGYEVLTAYNNTINCIYPQ